MNSRKFRTAIRPVALASALLAAGASHALTLDVTSTVVKAAGTASLDGTQVYNQTDAKSTGSVDVLDFSYSQAGTGSNSGLHSYGSDTGNFGSRASGAGVYDVASSFLIKQTITNNNAVAQNASFSFFITPGWISTSAVSAAGSFLDAAISFNVSVGSSSVWSSSRALHTTSIGTAVTSSGDQGIYSAGGTDGRSFNVGGQSRSVELGVINAGASIELTYELSTSALGNDQSDVQTIPGYTYTVPEQTIQYYDGQGYDANGYPCMGRETALARVATFDLVEGGGLPVGDSGSCGNVITEVIPAHEVVVPEQVIYGFGGSQSSSGDPFDINGDGSVDNGQRYLLAAPFDITVTGADVTNPVPEPSTYALMFAGLGLVGWAARRRKAV